MPRARVGRGPSCLSLIAAAWIGRTPGLAEAWTAEDARDASLIGARSRGPVSEGGSVGRHGLPLTSLPTVSRVGPRVGPGAVRPCRHMRYPSIRSERHAESGGGGDVTGPAGEPSPQNNVAAGRRENCVADGTGFGALRNLWSVFPPPELRTPTRFLSGETGFDDRPAPPGTCYILSYR